MLTPEIINGFQGSLLAPRYDQPAPTPDFHLDLWEWFCAPDMLGAAGAPRGHAKSTAITHAGILAAVLFRESTNVMILSDTEDQGKQFLTDIKLELEENEQLKEMFGFNFFTKELETDLRVSIGEDGHQFRIFIKAAGKSLRGSKWRSQRPDLIVGDDMENDEMVMNPERRLKLQRWLLRALIPMLADDGKIRLVGTVLHADSLLEYALNSKHWLTRRWKAHNKDFSQILWPEKFSKERLLELRSIYEEAGDLDGYAQEYLNEPVDETSSFFKRQDFIPYRPDDHRDGKLEEYLEYYIGVDLAISEKTRADYTVFFVVGVNKDGKKRVVDIVRGRFDTVRIIDEFFRLQERYKPQFFIVEDENINKAIGPVLYTEMERRQSFPLIETIRPSRDKVIRARSFIAESRAAQISYLYELQPDGSYQAAAWLVELMLEMLKFPRGKKDDQVDAGGLVFLFLRQLFEVDPSNRTIQDNDEEEDEDSVYGYDDYIGQSSITGY